METTIATTIWYELVDHETRRRSLQRTAASPIEVVPSDTQVDTCVGDFLAALVNELSVLPLDVTPTTFRVYVNRASYDGQHTPLPRGSQLAGLGTSVSNALVVEHHFPYKMEEMLARVDWRKPDRLCTGPGCDWPYQESPEMLGQLKDSLVESYRSWCDPTNERVRQGVHIVVGGVGTGKSRLLDEVPRLLRKAAEETDLTDLQQRMHNAYVFNVSFFGETEYVVDDFYRGDDVSLRMLYHMMKACVPWMLFADAMARFGLGRLQDIGAVLQLVATLKSIENIRDLTVIICVDGTKKLARGDGAFPHLGEFMNALVAHLHEFGAFTVCVCRGRSTGYIHQFPPKVHLSSTTTGLWTASVEPTIVLRRAGDRRYGWPQSRSRNCCWHPGSVQRRTSPV